MLGNLPLDVPGLSVIELFDLTQRRKNDGDVQGALDLYKEWLRVHPIFPIRHAVLFNYGVALSDAGQLNEAKAAFDEAIRLDPKFLPPYINLGTLLERMGTIVPAIESWTKVANILGEVNGTQINYKLTALKNLGRVFEAANLDAKAEEVLRLSLDVSATQRDVLQQWISLRQRQWKWPVLLPWDGMTVAMQKKGISPLSAACYADDPMLHLVSSFHFSQEDVGRPARFHDPADFAARRQDPARPLRVGYVSSDLRHHAVGFLTAELFSLHDRSQVEVSVYYCGIAATDPIKERIQGSVDHWYDIRTLDEDQAADLIFDHQIDILIDLNGYTKDARPKMFARRPAPILVNWLGFPGSMASPSHHYIIADDFIIPEGDEIFYTEKVLRLPCYQPNDRQRTVAAPLSRQEAGLPENGLVLCSFNGTQKITPSVFDAWLEILHQLPDAVLWLLKGGEGADERLVAHAVQRGIAAERLIFAGKVPNPVHVSRYALVDLFLDTFPYGAHTTCSDALWMGVPVLTLVGRGFASRVSGSLVLAAGLSSDFLCQSRDDYISRAIALGRDRPALRALRTRLLAGRGSSRLFDLPALVRSLEALYAQMWEDFRQDRLPRPDLRNLEIYSDLCTQTDHETAEFRAGPGYVEELRARLADLHRFAAVPADRRLWTSPT